MKRTQTVSIGIPAYNEEANIKHLLRALLHQTPDRYTLENIVVVSDASTDKTESLVRSVEDKRVRLIINKRRLGLNGTQNRIVTNTKSDILVLFDADVLPKDEQCISRLIKPIIDNPRVGLTSGKLYALRTMNKPIGRIIANAHEMKRKMFERLGNQNNVYLCAGRMRAFSYAFYSTLRWPDDVPEDAYSYFAAINTKFLFRYVREAVCYFHPSTTLDDHIKQNSRFTVGKSALKKYFPEILLQKEYVLPLNIIAKTSLEYTNRCPASIPLYFLMMFYIRFFVNGRKREQSRYETSASSKRMVSETIPKKGAMRILIPNGTSPRNIGDQAMLEGLLKLLQKSHSGASVTVHLTDPSLYRKTKQYVVRHTLYSWAVFADSRFFVRSIRLVELVLAYIFPKWGIIDRELQTLLDDYLSADLIIFVGGGYLRSKTGIKQSLNLLMQLVMFVFAKRVHTKTIVAPISFGPFGYRWQENLVAWTLRRVHAVSVRESISYSLLKKHHMPKLIQSCDHAFFIDPLRNTPTKQSHRTVVGFTIRNWGDETRQQKTIQAYIQALSTFARKTSAVIRPIIQVDSPMYGDLDASITEFIRKELRVMDIGVLPTKTIRDVRDGKIQYNSLDILLGMRMHSNILAASQGVPFVAISYEHKTEGIAKQIKMEKYCIRYERVNNNKLFEMLMKAYKNRRRLNSQLTGTIGLIRSKGINQWQNLLSHNLSI